MTDLQKIQLERDNEAETLYSELLLPKDTYDALKNAIKQARTLGYTWGDIGFALFKITSDAMYDVEQLEIVEQCPPSIPEPDEDSWRSD